MPTLRHRYIKRLERKALQANTEFDLSRQLWWFLVDK
jgi:hypothetical protein